MELRIRFAFDELKAAQAAAYLLRRHGRQMHGTRLIKLLYLADRRNFVDSAIPITGDDFINTETGPALKNILRLIAGEDAPGSRTWARYVRPAHGPYLACAENHDAGDLNSWAMRHLDAIYDQHGNSELPMLCRYARQLPEWSVPPNGSSAIDPYLILREEGFTPAMIEDVEEKAGAVYSLQAALAR